MNKELMDYKRAVQLLGQLEDKLGYTEEFSIFERQVNIAVDTGKNMSFVINSMTKKLDELNEK